MQQGRASGQGDCIVKTGMVGLVAWGQAGLSYKVRDLTLGCKGMSVLCRQHVDLCFMQRTVVGVRHDDSSKCWLTW